jgi:hypothetical protein
MKYEIDNFKFHISKFIKKPHSDDGRNRAWDAVLFRIGVQFEGLAEDGYPAFLYQKVGGTPLTTN